MAKVFTIDVSKCTGCYNCQLACKDEHVNNDWSPYSAPQPETGQFWLRLRENIRGTRPKVSVHYVAKLCNHCDNATCIDICPEKAIFRREDGLIIINPKKCSGCRICMDSCPYDAIFFNGSLNICQKCTGCAHLLDNGYTQPRCVEVCPTGALGFGEETQLQDFVKGAGVIKPETGYSPRVFYRNIPGQFIAGTLYDPVIKDVITGAKLRATNGGRTVTVVSDEYGDFWFTDLAVGKFDIVIEAKGYSRKTFLSIDTSECVNLGDIPLESIQ